MVLNSLQLSESVSYDDHSIVIPGRRPKNSKQDWNAHVDAPRKQHDDDDPKHGFLCEMSTVTLMHRGELKASGSDVSDCDIHA